MTKCCKNWLLYFVVVCCSCHRSEIYLWSVQPEYSNWVLWQGQLSVQTATGPVLQRCKNCLISFLKLIFRFSSWFAKIMGRVGGFYYLFFKQFYYVLFILITQFFPIENCININAQFKKKKIINFYMYSCQMLKLDQHMLGLDRFLLLAYFWSYQGLSIYM